MALQSAMDPNNDNNVTLEEVRLDFSQNYDTNGQYTSHQATGVHVSAFIGEVFYFIFILFFILSEQQDSRLNLTYFRFLVNLK